MKKLIIVCLIGTFSLPFFAADLFTADEGNVTYVNEHTARLHPFAQYSLRNQESWVNFVSQNGNWSATFDEFSQLPHRAFGQPIDMNNSDPGQASIQFMSDKLSAFQLPVNELIKGKINTSDQLRYVNFSQIHQGLKVLFSNAQVVMNIQSDVVSFRLNLYRDININNIPSIDAHAAGLMASANLPFAVSSFSTESQLAILPVPVLDKGYEYHLVYIVWLESDNPDGVPGKYYTLVDAQSGVVLYRQNTIYTFHPPVPVSADVEGTVVSNPLQAGTVTRLPYIKMTVNGGNYYADASGHLANNFNAPIPATFTLAGRWSMAMVDPATTSPSYNTTLQAGSNLQDFDPYADTAAISAYSHVSTVHDFMKTLLQSGFTELDTPMHTIVGITSGSCNAFYNGDVNFYAAGGGCPSTALFNDVVYHEYGHGISSHYYDYLGSSFQNGALGEGYSDIWGFMITQNPILGLGFSGGASTYVRRYDMDPKVYPQDLVGEVHADGEIIAGAWWDLYVNLGNDMPTMSSLFAKTLLATDMQASGMEGLLYRDVLISCLQADDVDADLTNGTPHDTAIIQAFAKHGITLITNSTLIHQELLVEPANVPISIDATLIVDLPIYLGDADLHYRVHQDSQWVATALVHTTGTNYTASIPAQAKGTIVDYYFTVNDIFGNSAVIEPFLANDADPNIPFQVLIGFEVKEKEDYDNNFGNWIVDPDGTDDASTGQWDINSPTATYSDLFFQNIVQTGTDHTSEGANLNICAVTGNSTFGASMGTNDVDDGHTTLQSPEFDLSEYTIPAFSYWRWYINDPASGANPGNDTWKVFISNDGSTWVKVERTDRSDVRWRKHAIRVSDYVTPSSTVSFRFVASDSLITGLPFDGGSIVEAGVDDLYLYDEAADINIGINTLESGIEIYPNPAYDRLIVHFADLPTQQCTISVIDELGRETFSRQEDGLQNRIMIPLMGMSSGHYWLRIVCNEKIINKAFVIQ